MDEHRRLYREETPGPPAEGPIELASVVPGDGPLELDIGFGRGMSVFERNARAPGSRILGIEIKKKWAYKVEQRRIRLGLDQVRIWGTDARDVLARSTPGAVVQRVFVHFPDPWWKKRHAKRKVLGTDVVDDLARLIAPGGDLYVQTDVEERAEEYLKLIREQKNAHGDPGFDVQGGGYIDENPFGSISNRERRAGEDGLPVYRIHAIRCA